MILIGSYIDSVSQADPVSMTKLMKGLDEFLERDQDRALGARQICECRVMRRRFVVPRSFRSGR